MLPLPLKSAGRPIIAKELERLNIPYITADICGQHKDPNEYLQQCSIRVSALLVLFNATAAAPASITDKASNAPSVINTSREAASYLSARGISVNTAAAYWIGFDPQADPANAPGGIGDIKHPCADRRLPLVCMGLSLCRFLPPAFAMRCYNPLRICSRKHQIYHRQAGATADTHPTLAQRSGVYGYHTTSREMLQDSRKENEP